MIPAELFGSIFFQNLIDSALHRSCLFLLIGDWGFVFAEKNKIKKTTIIDGDGRKSADSRDKHDFLYG